MIKRLFQKNKFLLHPYFGFTTLPGLMLRKQLHPDRISRLNSPNLDGVPDDYLDITSNNYGFFSKEEYTPAASSCYKVGIFGGSVASWFAIQRGEHFAKQLNKEQGVKIYNFAQAGFKQPQSLFVMQFVMCSAMLFDAVILIDGFNDAVLAEENVDCGTEATLPSVAYMSLFKKFDNYLFHNRSKGSEQPDCRLANVQFWVESVSMMYEICRAHQISFIHLLQPNQYYSKKIFSSEEQMIAISQTSPYCNSAPLNYPLFQEGVKMLQRREVNSYDCCDLFDDITDTVYSDNCCHYNNLGNIILENFILNKIKR